MQPTAPPTTSIRSFKQSDPLKVAALRKQRRPAIQVKHAVRQGALQDHIALARQFSQDCLVYSVWEALLYVEGYEESGHYAKGTAMAAWEVA